MLVKKITFFYYCFILFNKFKPTYVCTFSYFQLLHIFSIYCSRFILHFDIFLFLFFFFSLWELIYFQVRSTVSPHNILILMPPRGPAIKSFLFFLKHNWEMHKVIYCFVIVGRWNFKDSSRAGRYMSSINKILPFQWQINIQIPKPQQFAIIVPVLAVNLPPFFPKRKPITENHWLSHEKNHKHHLSWRKRIL